MPHRLLRDGELSEVVFSAELVYRKGTDRLLRHASPSPLIQSYRPSVSGNDEDFFNNLYRPLNHEIEVVRCVVLVLFSCRVVGYLIYLVSSVTLKELALPNK